MGDSISHGHFRVRVSTNPEIFKIPAPMLRIAPE
jgi:hypothetical protein